MSVWATRADLHDPHAFVHANDERDGTGRPSRPLCGAAGEGLMFLAEARWADIATTARCAACATWGSAATR